MRAFLKRCESIDAVDQELHNKVLSSSLNNGDRENQWLRAKHRSENPVKNKERGERLIALNSDVYQVLNDYIDHNCEDLTDEWGQKPLLTT
ncbi:hypothetical protein BRD16_05595 [Halobacteriales archaeon SW_6_65_46]|nr:MAG: hypothetical protein BRD16_05595 [Halobacteriales archaeon SW_6_65_46]